jgi:hypothetical protein
MSLHGGINLNVTGSLVIALIGRLYRSGTISKEFANQVFDDAQTNTRRRSGSWPSRGQIIRW